MKIIIPFLALLTLGTACQPTCRFRLCKPTTISLQSKSDVAVTSPVCRGRRPVGIINTGEARVKSYQGKYRLISKMNPNGLKQNYTRSFFKAYTIRGSRYSGIGHEVPQRNQAKFLGGRCVVLPIEELQKVRKGVVKKNVKLRGKPMRQCVSFEIAERD